MKTLQGRLHGVIVFALLSFIFFTACKKTYEKPTITSPEVAGESHSDHNLKDFKQVNLVANNDEYGATRIDPNLLNAWGLAWAPSGVAWIGAQAAHVSDVYNGEGNTVLGPVHIPSPGGPEGGNPTGVIFNPNAADFVIPSGNATPATGARFIFVGVDGVVSGWNGSRGTHAFAKFINTATAAYTGLALAANGGSNYLYAANFKGGRIDVWDRSWNTVAMSFHDPMIPMGYSPFNIQAIAGQLYVTYAKVGPDGRDQAGEGFGFVDIYTTAGAFVKRFASRGQLNAPWGVTMVAPGFFPAHIEDGSHHDNNDMSPAILIGNFGNGRINAFTASGDRLGELRAHGQPIAIEGLWALSFPPTTSTIDPHRLYFTAGPDDETHGLFGYIIQDPAVESD
jgi:uncharacterized protein (TIGR03118 family)